LIWNSISWDCQSQNKFGVGISVGKGELNSSSIVAIEPSMHLNRNMKVGLKIEGIKETEVRQGLSFTLSAQYYLRKRSGFASQFRPFVGIGGGVFFNTHSIHGFQVITPGGGWLYARIDGDSFRAQSGFYPRIGINYKRFGIIAEYNLIYRKYLSVMIYDPISHTYEQPVTIYRSDNYASLKIQFYIGATIK